MPRFGIVVVQAWYSGSLSTLQSFTIPASSTIPATGNGKQTYKPGTISQQITIRTTTQPIMNTKTATDNSTQSWRTMAYPVPANNYLVGWAL